MLKEAKKKKYICPICQAPMEGSSDNNMLCPFCGYGWGCLPASNAKEINCATYDDSNHKEGIY